MSHLTNTGEHLKASEGKPMNSLVPPQEEKATADPGQIPLAQQAAEWAKEKLPSTFGQYSDADPARDKAVSDSVRAGVVDDVGVEEQRKLYEPGGRLV